MKKQQLKAVIDYVNKFCDDAEKEFKNAPYGSSKYWETAGEMWALSSVIGFIKGLTGDDVNK